jgi:hypothetical protein
VPPVPAPVASSQPQAPESAADLNLDDIFAPTDSDTAEPEPHVSTPDLAALFAQTDESTLADEHDQAPAPASTEAPQAPLRRTAPPQQQPQQQPEQKEVLPEWVSDMRPSEGPVILRVGHQELRFQDQPLNQLPDKVRRLRERAKTVGQRSAAEAESIASGPLAGVAGAIAVMPDSIQPRIVIGDNTPLVVSDLDARRIKVIQNILGVEEQLLMERALAEDVREEKQAKVGAMESAPIRSRVKIDRFIVTILLALAIIGPFFSPVLNVMKAPDAADNTAAQQKALLDVGAAVNGLQANQPVLVAFEYGPTAAGELDDLARSVLRDIVKHGAHPVILSTNPSGIIHAQGLMQTLSTSPAELQLMGRADKPLLANQDYTILRYLPGGAIGVHSYTNALLSADFKQFTVQAIFQNDIAGRPSHLTDVSVVSLRQNPAFILAESPEDVRAWIEQYQAAPPLPPLKIVLLSSASASAVSQAYASSAATRVVGPLVGLRDAMIYQAQRQPLTDKAQSLSLQRWNSMALATLLAALIILLGAALNVIRNLRRRVSG